MDFRLRQGPGQPHGLQTQIWPLVASQTTVILRGDSNLKVNHSSSGPLWLPRARGILAGSRMGVGWVGCICICIKSRLLHTIPRTLLGNDNMPTLALSLTCHRYHASSSASLHGAHSFSVFVVFYLYCPHLHLVLFHCSGSHLRSRVVINS